MRTFIPFYLLLFSLCARWVLGVQPSSTIFQFPPNAGVLNVREEFGAKGDGVTDDTAAIQKAVTQAIQNGKYIPAFVYLPEGTYLVSDTIWSADHKGRWASGMCLLGENRDKTIIRLKDSAPGFNDTGTPKAILSCGSNDTRKRACGGNQAFANSFINLTVDAGAGNPGAVAIDYMANNNGVIKFVTLRAPADSGYCGILMERPWPGPALVKRTRIEGFDFAVRMATGQYSMTFEDLVTISQRKTAIFNDSNSIFLRKWQSQGSSPALESKNGNPFAVVIDSALSGTSGPAIVNDGTLFARNVVVTGFTAGASGKAGQASAADLASEYCGEATTGFGNRKTSLGLPVKETPEEWWTNDFSQWAIVTDFGATPGSPENNRDDDSAAIQQAIDSGKPFVFFPPGRYDVSNTVIVRGNVRKMAGGRAWILAPHGNGVDPILRIEPTNHDIFEMEYIRVHGQQKGKAHHAGRPILFDSPKTIVLRSPGGMLSNTARGTGDIFLEDYMAHLHIAHPVNLWARQINSEFGTNLISNKGGNLWLFGYKIEVGQPYGTVLRNERGKVELLGGQIYPLSMKPKGTPEPAFVGIDGQWSLVFKVTGQWPVVIDETRDGENKSLTREQIPNPAFYISE